MAKKPDITQDELKRVLSYDPDTGDLTWRVTLSNRAPAGRKAGTKNEIGYMQLSVHGREYLAHRLIWFYVHGRWPEQDVDHKNTNRADNRLDNLREATRAQNLQNANRKSNNTSGFKGVSWSSRRQKWIVTIKGPGIKQRCIGQYADKATAARAYKEAAEFYFGEFARVA